MEVFAAPLLSRSSSVSSFAHDRSCVCVCDLPPCPSVYARVCLRVLCLWMVEVLVAVCVCVMLGVLVCLLAELLRNLRLDLAKGGLCSGKHLRGQARSGDFLRTPPCSPRLTWGARQEVRLAGPQQLSIRERDQRKKKAKECLENPAKAHLGRGARPVKKSACGSSAGQHQGTRPEEEKRRRSVCGILPRLTWSAEQGPSRSQACGSAALFFFSGSFGCSLFSRLCTRA